MLSRWRDPPVRALLGVALLLVGVGCAILASAVRSEPDESVTRGDAPVNRGARNPGDISANNSPSAARNPTRPGNLVVVNRVDTPRFSCGMHVSFDTGARWSERKLPIPHGEQRKCFAPDVAFAADGKLIVSYVTLRGAGNVPHAGWIVTSADGGRTLSPPRRVLGPLAFQVRLATDPARPGRVYLTWLQADEVGIYRFEHPGNPIEAARSDDGGATWTRPARVSDPRRGRVLAPSPAVGPRGELYVLYLDVGGDRLDYDGAHEGFGGPPYPGRFSLVLARSRNGGATWDESVADDRVVPARRFIAFLPPFPSLAVDRGDGRVYAAFEDGRSGMPDVFVWSLARGAAAWRGPTRVNDTPRSDRTSQYLPKLAVAPGGRLDLAYYDRRNDPRNVRSEVSLQSSFDGGRSFSPHLTLTSRPFDSRIGFGSERHLPDLGSRLALLSDDRSATAFWTDTRAGTVASNKQDVASAVVSVSEPSGTAKAARPALRWGGVAIALAGLALLAVGVVRRRMPIALD